MNQELSAPAPTTVLIVDDDADIREALSDLLGNEGYTVETAGTGKEALEKAGQRPFGAVLLDIGLPDIDGISVLKSLVESYPTLPVIILTAYTHSQQTIDSLSRGAFAYLTKPYNRDELKAILRRAVGAQALALRAEQTESALTDSKDRLRLAMEAALLGTWDWDIPKNKITYSDNLRPLFGQPPRNCLPTYEAFLETVHPDDRPRVSEAVRRSLEEGAAYGLDFRTIWPDGSIRWIYDSGQVVRDGSGRPAGMLGIAMDITERKLAEERLLLQQIEQQVLLDLIPAMVWYKDLHNRIIRANWAAAVSINKSVAEVEGQSTYDLYPEEAEKYYQDDLAVISSGRPKLGIIEPYQTASGEKRWVKTDKVPYRDAQGKVIGVLVFAQDITEHKLADEALQKSEERYHALYEDNPSMYFTLDAGGTILSVNRFGAEQLQSSVEELVGQSVLNVFLEDDRARVLQQLRWCEEHAGEPCEAEFRKVRKDGSLMWVRETCRTVTSPQGQVMVLVVCENITKGKRSEEALSAERAYSSLIINATSAIVCGIAPDGTTTFINPAGERIAGYQASELLGQNWWRTFYPGDEYRQVERLFRNFARGDVRDYEMVLRTRSGEKRTISWNSFNRLDADGNIVEIIGFGNDVTARKHAT